MVKVVAIIQARMGSTRLPGKVLMSLSGRPVLQWVHDACRKASGVHEVWIATSAEPRDDAIQEFCEQNDIDCVRGSETDVLDRFCMATLASQGDVLLRITGDCPFVDPEVIAAVVRLQKQTGAAYVSNVSPRTYPDGLDVQCFTKEALFAAHAEATRAIDRDCVCTWIERNQSRFPAETVICPVPGLEKERWVLDTASDYAFCQEIAVRAKWWKHPPTMYEILAILDEEPELRDINKNHVMNERYFDALAEEPLYDRTFERSQLQLARAQKVIPLGAQTFSKSHLQFPQPSPLFLSHGQGGLVWDVDGNEYVDLVSALLPNILGHRDVDVDVAIRRQSNSGVSFSLATELEAELAETLCRLIPCAEMVRFGKSGTDVTSAAVRLARAHTGRVDVVICGGYHGWQDWSTERNIGVPLSTRSLTRRVPFGDRQTLSLIIDADRQLRYPRIAAVIVEPEYDAGYLMAVRDLCDQHGIVLIFDEVITGFRFDLGGAQKLWGVTPDLACFGKAMANGMPLSAIVGKREIMKRMAPPDNIFYSGTMFGETLSIAAAIATIKKLERDNVIEKLWDTGNTLAQHVEEMIDRNHVADAIKLYGAGPMKRIKFKDDQIAALFRREMIKTGVLVIASHNLCAAHTPGDIRRVLKSYDHTLDVIRDALDKGDITERLAGATVGAMVRTA